MAENHPAEKINFRSSLFKRLDLSRNKIRDCHFSNCHLVFDMIRKPVIQMPGIHQAEQKSGRSKTFPSVDKPGVEQFVDGTMRARTRNLDSSSELKKHLLSS